MKLIFIMLAISAINNFAMLYNTQKPLSTNVSCQKQKPAEKDYFTLIKKTQQLKLQEKSVYLHYCHQEMV